MRLHFYSIKYQSIHHQTEVNLSWDVKSARIILKCELYTRSYRIYHTTLHQWLPPQTYRTHHVLLKATTSQQRTQQLRYTHFNMTQFKSTWCRERVKALRHERVIRRRWQSSTQSAYFKGGILKMCDGGLWLWDCCLIVDVLGHYHDYAGCKLIFMRPFVNGTYQHEHRLIMKPNPSSPSLCMSVSNT